MSMSIPIDEFDVLDLTVAEARRLIEVIPNHADADELTSKLDVAQGAVHSGTTEETWVVIRITP